MHSSFSFFSFIIMSSETACKANETHKDVGALLSNMSSGRWAWSMNRVCVCVCVSRTTSPLHFASHSHFTITLPNAFDISLRTSACRQTKYHTNTQPFNTGCMFTHNTETRSLLRCMCVRASASNTFDEAAERGAAHATPAVMMSLYLGYCIVLCRYARTFLW